MANRRRETEAEKARREREERIELLKMKQGLIEESEIIPQNERAEAPKLSGWKKFTNFFYHNRPFILLGAFFAFVATVLVVQLVTREKEDLYVLAIAFEEDSELGWRVDDLETALERYCPDFDGNGKVHVSINYIDRTSGQTGNQYDEAQIQKLSLEFMSATAQFIIADEKYLTDWFGGEDENSIPYEMVFLDQSGLCSEDMLYGGVGVRAGKTGFAKEAKWESCPDNVVLLVRSDRISGSDSAKKIAENRERSMTVLKNIIDNNIVNPAADGE